MRALSLGVAAPLAAKMAWWADAAPGDRPTRLFIFYMPHGWPVEHVEPLGASSSWLDSSSVLSPFAPFSDQVTVVRGLSMNDGAQNHAAIRATLTGFSEGGRSDSIDEVVADALGVQAHVLGAIPYSAGSGFTSDAFLVKHGSWVRPVEDPAVAAEALLGSLGAPRVPDQPGEINAAQFRAETLALTEAELEQLDGAMHELTDESTKLRLHLDAIRELKAGGGSGPGVITCDDRPVLPAVDATAGLDVLDPANLRAILDAQLEVVAASMVCGTAQVITLQNLWVNADVNMGFAGGPGIPKGHHEPISHSWDAAGRVEFASCQRWFLERLTEKVISVLAQTPDPADPDAGHTMLDNSIVYVCSEVCDGANHNSDATDVWLDGQPHPSSLPAVLLGGGSGYLNPGRVVDVQRNHLDLLATLADGMGVGMPSLGGQAVDVIEELLA